MIANNSTFIKLLKISLLSCLLLAALPVSLWAGEFTAFGPHDYIRQTAVPVTVTNHFTLLNPNTKFFLRVYNGGLSSAGIKVSSAVISINGKQVAGPEKFNQQVKFIEVPVSLQLSNAIEVEVRAKPGGLLTIKIVGIDNTAPRIQIIAPADGSLTNINPYGIKLSFSDDISGINPNTFKLSINDIDKSVLFNITTDGLSGSASGEVLLSEGSNVIKTNISDFAGNTNSVSSSFIIDTTPPQISKLSPADGSILGNAKPTILAEFSDNISGIDTSTAKITLDGLEVTTLAQIASTGFSYTPDTDLSDGSHNVTGDVKDKAGNPATQVKWSFITDVTAPQVTIEPVTSPTNISTQIITGSYIEERISAIKVNGITAAINEIAKVYSAQISLLEGMNNINVIATDLAGNSGSASTTIFLDTTPPAIPLGLVATAGDTIVDLSWSANTESDFGGYNIYRSQISPGPYIQINSELITQTSYQDTGLINGTTYYYVLTVQDKLGNKSGYSQEVSAMPQVLLQVTAKASPNSGYAPLPVSFFADTLGNISLYEWDFDGNGTYDWSSPSSPNTVYTYKQLGAFNPTIKVTSPTGKTLTDTIAITVQHPLIATANASPATGVAPLKVTFIGSGIDQTGTITKYEWDFNGDGIYDWSSAFSQNAYYTYARRGTYTAVLRLTDNNGYTDAENIVITVNPALPVATAQANTTNGGVPLTVNFTGKGTDPDGAISKYEWDFDGDGVYDWSSTVTGNTSYTYSNTGTYNAAFKVTDNDGLTDTDLIVITASQPGSPTASASANPSKGKAPLTVNFSGTAADSDGYIALYEWDFDGDGTYDWSATVAPTDPFKDDVESGPDGWTATGLWHISQHRSQSASWAWYYGQEEKWNYDTGTTNSGYLTSPVIDLTGIPSPLLTFWRWYQTEGGTSRDKKFVQISINGGITWTTLKQISTSPSSWIKEEINLTAYANKQIQIRFYFDTVNASANYYEGWHIDDIYITSVARVSYTYNEAGQYDAVFRATDNSNLNATTVVPIDVDYNISLSISPDSFKPSQAETTNINTNLFGGDIKFTLLVKDKNANTVKTLLNEQPRVNGSYIDTWDGTDDQGNIVADGVYYFVIQYTTLDGRNFTYDLTATTGGTQRTLGGYSAAFPGSFSPYDDQFCPITYNVPYKGEVTAYIAPFNPTYQGEKIKTLLERVPQGKGSQTIYWDGTNDQGKMAPPVSPSYLVAIWSWDLPDNSVIVIGARPEISNISAEPNYFDPSYHSDEPVGYRPTTVTYTLSKNADAVLKVYDLNNVLIRTVTQTNVPAGINTITWDGRNDSGNLVANGQYKLGIKATDTEGNESVTMFSHVVVFY